MATLSFIPEGDPELTAYLNKLLRTNEPEQQNNTFWLPTTENPAKEEDHHTTIQTGILKELVETKKNKGKLKPTENAESRAKLLETLDWTITLLPQTDKQALKIFCMRITTFLPDVEWILECSWSLGWKLHWKTIKLLTTKTYQCQSTWKKIYSLSWLWCTFMVSSPTCPLRSTQVPFLHKETYTEDYVFLRLSGKSTL